MPVDDRWRRGSWVFGVCIHLFNHVYLPHHNTPQANEIEHPGVDIKGFPTLLFFPNGKKDSPVKYEGPREVNDFIDFLKEHSTKAFEVRACVAGVENTKGWWWIGPEGLSACLAIA